MSTTISRPGVSFSSPQFSPDGKFLAFTSDETGWRSLWVADADGDHAVRLETGMGEIGRPDWVPGMISMRWSGDGRSIYTVRRHESRDAILRIAWPEREVMPVETQWTEVSGLNVMQDRLVFMGAKGTAPSVLVTLEGNGTSECVRATSAVGVIDRSSLSEPEVMSWRDRWRCRLLGHSLPRQNFRGRPETATVNRFCSRGTHFRQGGHLGPASAILCYSGLALLRPQLPG